MKTILAYGILVVGIPNYFGVIAGTIFMPIAWLFPDPTKPAVIQLLCIPKGIISIGIALLVLHLFGLPVSVSILIITVVWISIYYLILKQPLLGWISYVIGIFVGWYFFLP